MPPDGAPARASSLGRGARAAFAAFAFASVCAAGCIYTSDEGLTPPLTAFYYPTGLAVSPGGRTLYVINSDFDLQFNGGTVQALDLTSLRPNLLSLTKSFAEGKSGVEACSAVGLQPSNSCDAVPPFICTNDVLNPGPCAPFIGDPSHPLVKSFATIGAFASDVLLVTRPDAPGARLFVPVRGDPSITYFDVDDDRTSDIFHPCAGDFCLECGGTGSELRCDTLHKIGQNPFENTRDLVMPTEPIGIASSADGTALVVAHDTVATVSLSINAWTGNQKPTLQFALTDLQTGPTDVAALPPPKYIAAAVAQAQKDNTPFDYQPGFLISYRATAVVDLLRYASDSTAHPPRPFLTRVGEFGISTNADSRDSRGIAIDPSQRQNCEAKCADDDATCLRGCLENVPLRLFIANRSPASLLVGEIQTKLEISEGGIATGAFDLVNIFKTIPLDVGPANVVVGQAIDPDGKPVTRVFVVCFDSRFVFMYDPESYMVEATFHTGRGPQGIALDTASDHSFLYVAHFTDSYLGVIDLDMRNPTFGTMFASIGEPLPPLEAK